MRSKEFSLAALLLIVLGSCGNPLLDKIFPPRTITFETNGGSHVARQTVYKGSTIERPANPVKEGYTFDAWYSDNETFKKQWNFKTLPSGDMTLYANWTVITQQTGDDTIINCWVDDAGEIVIGTGGQPLPNNTVTVKNGGSITFAAGGSGYSGHNWTLNGSAAGTGSSYTFDTSDNDKEPGRNYIIGLTVQRNGRPYFSEITVRVEE